ncbi:DUF2793 domain-containing protein [Alteriqipengyuania flavescens]|uniref:DUF2793 domain-containing protein n=1 Tax=Alteriqipengyuania flavescens TaxID=3053610 RepID=UPI0025B4D90B|nr:DUF2793 domain-containing protein [Alteriqipengyuania flavescens]WJY19457.1 DUF2793 domain-containing protein [Alteriqipengyuania flavescens]WJY25399.1 DUF2793 domain-containing protein [Alteriqipengyuania flavescens]
MTEPIAFASLTSRHSLPLLFPGQAAKEATLNEAIVRLDCLVHPVILGEALSDPANPNDGDAWIVGPAAGGAFAGRDDAVAFYAAGAWHFLDASPGLVVFDANLAIFRRFDAGWQQPTDISDPSGGTSVDNEARVAIGEICQLLREAGLLA